MGQVIKQALDFVNSRNIYINKLKDKSPYYPAYIGEIRGAEHVVSSLVRIKREGKWYAIHLVKEYTEFEGAFERMINQFNHEAYNIIHLYIVSERDEVDKIQISEEERLKRMLL